MGATIKGPPCPVCGSTDTTTSVGVLDPKWYIITVDCRSCWDRAQCKKCKEPTCMRCRVSYEIRRTLKSDCENVRRKIIYLKGVV